MNEEAKFEKEASAPLLVQIIEENNIKGVLLDLDETLFKTSSYFVTAERELSFEIAETLNSTVSNEQFAIEIATILKKQFLERARQPIPVTDRYMLALSEYLGKELSTPLVSKINKHFENFYDVCPELIDGSVEMLSLLKNMGICFAFNSHAQDKWTKLKALKFAEELNMHAIPYNSIALSRSKDASSWCKSARYIGKDIGETLVVGDSLMADILPAIEAGCKNLIWIKGDLDKLPLEIRENSEIHIWCVDSVKELMI